MVRRERLNVITSQHVEVGLIYRFMLGVADADNYLRAAGVPDLVIHRVLHSSRCRISDPREVTLMEKAPERRHDRGAAVLVDEAIALAHRGRRSDAQTLLGTIRLKPGSDNRILSLSGKHRGAPNTLNSKASCRRQDFILAAHVDAALLFDSDRAQRILLYGDAPPDVISRVKNALKSKLTASPSSSPPRIRGMR